MVARRSLKKQPSVDCGYAWVTLASCFVLRMLVDGFWSCLGIFFLRWQVHFDIGASYTAWIGSIFMLILLSTAPVSSALAHRFTYRVVVVGAGIIVFTCLFALSMTSSLWHIYLIMPILGMGLGVGLQTGCAFFVVFFDKKLALANGLNSAASAVGFLSLPPLMEIMISIYGWRGALQITSAIMANFCVCGFLLQSPPQLKSEPKLDKPGITDAHKDKDVHMENNSGSFLGDIAKSFDLSLFRNIRFIFQGVGNGLLYGANNTAIIYLIPYAVSVGIWALDASYLMLGFGISGVVVRLCPIGSIVDKNFISASTLGGIAFFICGLNIVVTSFITSFKVLMIVSVVYGVSIGIGAFLRMVVVTYAAGSKEKAPGAIAWMLLYEGIGNFCCILAMGFLYDLSGNYQSALIVSGACLMCLGLNMLADPCFFRYQNWCHNRKERQCRPTQSHIYSSLSMKEDEKRMVKQTKCTQV